MFLAELFLISFNVSFQPSLVLDNKLPVPVTINGVDNTCSTPSTFISSCNSEYLQNTS